MALPQSEPAIGMPIWLRTVTNSPPKQHDVCDESVGLDAGGRCLRALHHRRRYVGEVAGASPGWSVSMADTRRQRRTIRSRSRSETIPAGSTAADGPSSAATVTDARFDVDKASLARARVWPPETGRRTPSLSRPLPAARSRRMPQRRCLRRVASVCRRSVRVVTAGSTQIELDSPRASLGHIRTERRNRRRCGRYQRLTPVVALRIHSPEVRS